jgi:hypothetical protein
VDLAGLGEPAGPPAVGCEAGGCTHVTKEPYDLDDFQVARRLVAHRLTAGRRVDGWLDRWLHTFPFFTGAGIVVAFGLAIRDMLRLRDEIFDRKP